MQHLSYKLDLKTGGPFQEPPVFAFRHIDIPAFLTLYKRMRGFLLAWILWTGVLLILPAPAGAADSPAASTDHEIIERLTRVETRLDEGLKRLEDSINQLREDMQLQNQQLREDMQLQNQQLREDMQQLREGLNNQLDRHFQLILGVLAAFTLMFISILGFAVWDRRTMVRPFSDKVKSLEDDLSTKGRRLDVILDALRSLGQRDERVAAILKRLNLL